MPPAATLALFEEPAAGATEKSIPVPLSATVCGLPAALSVIVKVPFLTPPTLGAKVTEMEQLAPAAILFAQLFVSAKSPLIAIVEICSAAFPALLNVIAWAALLFPVNWPEKFKLEGENASAGPMPVPVTGTFSGVLRALFVNTTVPVRLSGAVGVKVTSIVQFAPTATVAPQPFDSEKSPVVVILLKFKGTDPGFTNCSCCDTLLVPTASGEKESAGGNIDATEELRKTETEFPYPPLKLGNTRSDAPLPSRSAVASEYAPLNKPP